MGVGPDTPGSLTMGLQQTIGINYLSLNKEESEESHYLASALRIKAEETDLLSPKAIKSNKILQRYSIGGPRTIDHGLKSNLRHNLESFNS